VDVADLRDSQRHLGDPGHGVAYDSRLATHSLIRSLQAVPALSSLEERNLLAVVGASSNLFWKEGSVIFERGSAADALYIVLSGCVQIFDGDAGSPAEVARVEPGDYFGELSLLLETTHTKGALAAQDSELLVVPAASFHDLLREHPDLAAQFHQKVERLRGAVGH
jgi:CRP-like cAMP-binding protein